MRGLETRTAARITRLVTVALAVGGCHLARHDQAARSDEASRTPSREPTRANLATPLKTTVFDDLLQQIERAEMGYKNWTFVDFGTAGAAKYTLGGWRSRVGGDVALGDTTYAVTRGVTSLVFLDATPNQALHVAVCGRSFGDERLTIYLNDKTVGHAKWSEPATDAVAQAHAPADGVKEHNTLRLRVPTRGRAPDGSKAGFAVNWIAWSRPEQPPSPPPRFGLRPQIRGSSLHLQQDWKLRFTLHVPEHASLHLRATSRETGSVAVRARGDTIGPVNLAELQTSNTASERIVDLQTLAQRVIELELEAAHGDVRIDVAHIRVPSPSKTTASPRTARNVIVYLTDTLRADKLSASNPKTRVRTPGFTRWASQATLMLNARSQENWTKPSVATLLTSTYPWEHNASSEDSRVPKTLRLLSETLQAKGFFTGAFIANGFISDRFGFERGWDTWRNYLREGRNSAAAQVASDVVAWLDHRPKDKRFFLYVHTIDPHVPYIPPDDTLGLYDARPYKGPVDFRRDRLLLEKVKSGKVKLAARDKEHLEALHDAEISYHDTHFAAIMDALEHRDLVDDTVVVFTSDHGEEFFDHGSVGHGHSMWDELLHVPLAFRLPGVTGNTRKIAEGVGLVDVAPTLLEALGLPPDEQASGRSLISLLRGAEHRRQPPVVAGFMDGWRAIVMDGYKLILRTERHASLFDLGRDPAEQHDLAQRRPTTVRWLRGLLGLSLHRARLRPESTNRRHGNRITIDRRLRSQLEALGYTEPSGAAKRSPPAR